MPDETDAPDRANHVAAPGFDDAVVGPEDPRAVDVRALIEAHLEFTTGTTPPEYMFALGVEALVAPDVSFFSARREGELLGVAALQVLDATNGEVKSMHTAESARGTGVGRALLDRVISEARSRGIQRLSLETGSQPAFAAAHRLYARAGFVECGPFGDYVASGYSRFFTLDLRGLTG